MGYCKPFTRGASWRSQNYGANPNNGTNGPAGHSGYDEACDIGTPVHAAGDGVIEYAGTFDDTYADNLLWLIDFGGNILVLNCGDSEPTFIYAHLSKFRVKAGDRVRKGQIIADSGNSGTRTTGPHCHVEAIPPGFVLNSPSLGRVNPDRYLTEWPDDYAGIAAMGGAITPLSEEDDMAYSEADLTRIIAAAVQPAHEVTRANIIKTVTENTEAQHAETRKQVIGMTQAQSDVTRGYLADRVRDASPADLVAAIPDDIAQQVIDGLGARLAGSK